MGRRLGTRFVAILLMVLARAGSAVAAEIRVAGDAEPEILSQVEPPEGFRALAIDPEGSLLAVASPDPEREQRSVIRVYAAGGGEPVTLPLGGIVRSLLFDPRGTVLYAIRFRPAKKRAGDAELLSVDLSGGRTRSVMRLPASACGLDYWAGRESLVVTGENEIRTVRLDGLRSGPLFRVPGPNAAIAALAASDVVLLAQGADLLLLDLSDPHGQEAMPVRDRVTAPATVSGLAADPDGTSALARLIDGRVIRVTFAPLALEAAGSADAVLAAGKHEESDPVPLPPLAARTRGSEEPTRGSSVSSGEVELLSPVVAAPEDPPSSSETAPDPPVAGPVDETPAPAIAPDSRSAVPKTPPGPGSAPPVGEEPASPRPAGATALAPVSEPEGRPQVWGRLEGPSRDAVVEVVLLGPDNLLREALRVRPSPGGVWQADGLPPGRYQVQLAGGPNRVLVSDPRAVVVHLGPDDSVEAQSFRVLRAYEP